MWLGFKSEASSLKMSEIGHIKSHSFSDSEEIIVTLGCGILNFLFKKIGNGVKFL